MTVGELKAKLAGLDDALPVKLGVETDQGWIQSHADIVAGEDDAVYVWGKESIPC